MAAARVLACGVAALAAVSCAGGSVGGGDEIVVFAAASLTEAFDDLDEEFSAEHPGIDVTISYAGSSSLAAQIIEGAPADVFAAADQVTMQRLVDAGSTAGQPVVFAENRLEIIVAPGNPLGIAGVADLARPGLVVVTCAPEVPIGRYTAELFQRAGVDVTADSLEQHVKAVVSKVVLGEADAGVVYATDVLAAGDGADGVAIPPELNVAAEYPIALTADGDDGPGREFIEFVTGQAGQRILGEHGFATS